MKTQLEWLTGYEARLTMTRFISKIRRLLRMSANQAPNRPLKMLEPATGNAANPPTLSQPNFRRFFLVGSGIIDLASVRPKRKFR